MTAGNWLFVVTVVLLLYCCQGLDQSKDGVLSQHTNWRQMDRGKRSEDPNPEEAVMAQLSEEVKTLAAQLEAVRNDFASQLQAVRAEVGTAKEGTQGSTFIRWGRTSCPDNSDTVYSGIVGGAWFNEAGGSANHLCLSLQPDFDNATRDQTYYGTIYGAEYERLDGLHNYDVPCAVCQAVETNTMMVPGTSVCPSGWTEQYSGHLTSNYRYYHRAGEYLCLDSSPETIGSPTGQDGALFAYVVTVCGSLPCPPYENDRVVSCVVCSK